MIGSIAMSISSCGYNGNSGNSGNTEKPNTPNSNDSSLADSSYSDFEMSQEEDELDLIDQAVLDAQVEIDLLNPTIPILLSCAGIILTNILTADKAVLSLSELFIEPLLSITTTKSNGLYAFSFSMSAALAIKQKEEIKITAQRKILATLLNCATLIHLSYTSIRFAKSTILQLEIIKFSI